MKRTVTRRMLLVGLAGLVALGAAACVGPTLIVQQYAGPVRPQETISVLRVNGREPVQLVTLDGEDVAVPIASDSRLHIELLPGRHAVTVQNMAQRTQVAGVEVMAEAGRVYRIVFVAIPDREGSLPRIYEVDRGSDALVRDVTLERRALPMPPRRSTLDAVSPAPDAGADPNANAPVDAGAD